MQGKRLYHPFTIHNSPFTIHNSQFTIHHSPVFIQQFSQDSAVITFLFPAGDPEPAIAEETGKAVVCVS
jgi:hypothetical protein